MNLKYLVCIFSVIIFNIVYVEACKGCVNLGELNFNKIIQKFPVTLVKFDVAFPYGDKHEIFSKFSEDTASINDLLFAEVGVKDYGEKENENLAIKYGITKDDYPAVILFKRDVDKPIVFPKETDFVLNNLRSFVRSNTNIYIGLPGCLEKFDRFVSDFVDSDEQVEIVKQAEKEIDKLKSDEEKSFAKVYVTLMKKVIESGSWFIIQESERVTKLLDGKVSTKKKTELQNKLNILRAFKLPHKEEL